MDGERVFNAAVALGVDVDKIVKPVDSIMFGLSKGLCCPVGSVLVGSKTFIEKVRIVRKMLGGQMRQAGIIAASGIVALDSMINRLAIDHTNAQRLAQGLSKLSYIKIDLKSVQTNLVRFKLVGQKIEGMELTQMLKKSGILVDYRGGGFRMVTNKDVNQNAVDKALNLFQEIENNM